MSGSLRIALDRRPLERVPARLALAGVFEDERPLRGAAGRADWRLCGLLSESLRAGRMTGREGEATLVGTSGRLASDAVLVIGLGPRVGYDGAAFGRAVTTAFGRVAGLAASAVAIGPFGLDAEQWVVHARAFVDGALAGLGSHATAALLCVAEGDETRLQRELVRCGRNRSVDVEARSPLPTPAPDTGSTRFAG